MSKNCQLSIHSLLNSMRHVHKRKHQKMEGCAKLRMQKQNKKNTTVCHWQPPSRIPLFKAQKSWKQAVLVEDDWFVHSHGSPGPFMTVLCWAQMAFLWRLLFSGLKPRSLFLVFACSMTWVQLYLIYFFAVVFVMPTALLTPNQTNKCVCFHYAAMGFAEWENMRWTQLSM